jgi:titin
MATAGDTEVTLSWTVPGSDGGSAVTEYQYRVSDDAGSTWSPDWTDVPDGSDSGADRSDERSYTVTGLDNGVLHTFEVRAVNVVGEGAPASATSTPVTVPEAPASLNATPGDTQATLAWTAPASDGGSAVTGYEYRYKTTGEFPDEWRRLRHRHRPQRRDLLHRHGPR